MASTADPNLEQRRLMVDRQIRARGVRDERVLAALEAVRRERFVLPADQDAAFDDRALPFLCGQTISQPYMVGAMTAALGLEPEHRVLEIGTGSGYHAAVMSRLAREVYTIERVEELSLQARSILLELGCDNVHFRVGDGSLGWPEAAPFDRIIVTAGAPQIPPALTGQLEHGGRLVIPVGDESEQTLLVVRREGERTIKTAKFPCRFVKLLGQQAWPGH